VLTRRVARSLIAGAFIVGGIDAFRAPEPRATYKLEPVARIAKSVGLPDDPVTLVKLNAGVMLGAGSLLAIGKAPRLASVAILSGLVPTTIIGHPFWTDKERSMHEKERMHFMKNAAMAGGLVMVLLDTEGRPSIPWRAKRAARKASEKLPIGR
jgi:uncharacterized membrane protein YphA (DoxX/SURF4 family)